MLEFFNQYIHPSSSTRAKLSIHLIARASTGASAAAAEDSAAAEENPGASSLRENQDIVAVNNGHKPSVCSTKIPVKVEDVKELKASLNLSAAATPVKALTEFEEFG